MILKNNYYSFTYIILSLLIVLCLQSCKKEVTDNCSDPSKFPCEIKKIDSSLEPFLDGHQANLVQSNNNLTFNHCQRSYDIIFTGSSGQQPTYAQFFASSSSIEITERLEILQTHLPHPIYHTATAVLDDRVVLFLGGKEDELPKHHVRLYYVTDFEADFADTGPEFNLSNPRYGHTLTKITNNDAKCSPSNNTPIQTNFRDEIIVIGGAENPIVEQISCELSIGRSNNIPFVPPAQSFHLAIGGESDSDATLSDTTFIDLALSTSNAQLNENRRFHTATYFEQNGQGKIFVMGGVSVNDDNTPITSAEIYDVASSAIQLVNTPNNIHLPFTKHTVTRLFDNRILIMGGQTGNPDIPIAAATIYDPTSINNKFSSLELSNDNDSSIIAPRHSHAAIDLSSIDAQNRVLIIGGHDGQEALGSILYFDSSDNRFTTIGNHRLTHPRYGHTANYILGSNEILIAGGYDSNGQPVPEIEIILLDEACFDF